MNTKLISFRRGVLFVAALGLSACNPSSQLPQVGIYQGTLIHTENQRLEKIPVYANVSDYGNNGLSISLGRQSGGALQEVTLHLSDSNTMDLNVDELGSSSLKLNKDGDCFLVQAPRQARVCPSPTKIEIMVDGNSAQAEYALTLSMTDRPRPLPLETPRTFTLPEAMNQAFKMNFNNRIELQRSMQAKLLSKNAYLNLLPHLTGGSITALAQMDPYSLGAAIGDLAPFLLPSRWFHAAQEAHLADSEQDALILMRADTGLEVEAFAYALNRDQEVLKDYDEAIQGVKAARQQVLWEERTGTYPRGTADNLLSIVHSLESDRDTLVLNDEEQKTFVAQSLGFINPKAVTALTLTTDPLPIENASPLDDQEIWPVASDRSYELKQMDALILAAQSSKSASFFEWLDPSGDPTAALGAGLPSAIAIQDSQVQQVRIAREQTQAILLQKVTNAVLEYNNSIEQFAKAKEDLVLQEKRVQATLDDLHFGNQMTLIDLVSVFQDRLRAQTILASSEAAFRLNRARLDRLLLKGYYHDFLTSNGSPEHSVLRR